MNIKSIQVLLSTAVSAIVILFLGMSFLCSSISLAAIQAKPESIAASQTPEEAQNAMFRVFFTTINNLNNIPRENDSCSYSGVYESIGIITSIMQADKTFATEAMNNFYDQNICGQNVITAGLLLSGNESSIDSQFYQQNKQSILEIINPILALQTNNVPLFTGDIDYAMGMLNGSGNADYITHIVQYFNSLPQKVRCKAHTIFKANGNVANSASISLPPGIIASLKKDYSKDFANIILLAYTYNTLNTVKNNKEIHSNKVLDGFIGKNPC